jgi:hypothetical protein
MIDRLVLVQWVALAVSEERSLAHPVAPVMGGFVLLTQVALALVLTSLHLFHLLVVVILGVVSLGFC